MRQSRGRRKRAENDYKSQWFDIRWGLVKETGLIPGNKGRRSISIAIDESRYAVLSVRIARTRFSVGAFHLAGGCICEKTIEYGHSVNTQKKAGEGKGLTDGSE